MNALGELDRIDGTPLTWDADAYAATLLSVGDTDVFHAPGAITGIGDTWTTGGWRGTRTTATDDPWDALTTANTLGGGTVAISPAGGLDVAGLEWMGARAYDPTTRGFLSTDPLTAPAGAAWSANPYSFAGNDPLHAVDPLGLQPVTDEQLTAYANAHQGALATAGNAIGEWWNENWEYVAGGAMVIAGGVMIATGVGGPIGAALIGAGADTIIQKATTGEVNWGQVALTGAFGLIPGAGAAGGLLARTGANAAQGAVENTAQYLISGQPITPGGLLANAATGATMSAVTAGALNRVPAGNAITKLDTLPPNLAETFSGGVYRTSVLDADTVLYRAGSTQGSPLGQFFSTDPPVGVIQTRIDKAIPPVWPDGTPAPLDTGFAVHIPAGTQIHTGTVANQGGLYMGGTEQIVVQKPWEIPGVQVVDQWPLN